MSPSFSSAVGVAEDSLHPDSKQLAISAREIVIFVGGNCSINLFILAQVPEIQYFSRRRQNY